MKNPFQFFILISLLVGSFFSTSAQAYAKNPACAYQLSFNDEFNGTSLDATKWRTQFPSGNGGEQQFYTPDALSIQNGMLSITAQKQSAHGFPYTSGIITTQQNFAQTYGFFTMRAKLPAGQGFWPAFWMLPAQPDYPTEVDVFEMLGNAPGTLYMSNHWHDDKLGHQKNIVSYDGPDYSKDFHTFSILWTPRELIWYVDGVQRYQTTVGVPDMPMYLLMNLAVGGDWPGNPNSSTPFPSSMLIDYIRVYRYDCSPSFVAAANRLEWFLDENIYKSTTAG